MMTIVQYSCTMTSSCIQRRPSQGFEKWQPCQRFKNDETGSLGPRQSAPRERGINFRVSCAVRDPPVWKPTKPTTACNGAIRESSEFLKAPNGVYAHLRTCCICTTRCLEPYCRVFLPTNAQPQGSTKRLGKNSQAVLVGAGIETKCRMLDPIHFTDQFSLRVQVPNIMIMMFGTSSALQQSS